MPAHRPRSATASASGRAALAAAGIAVALGGASTARGEEAAAAPGAARRPEAAASAAPKAPTGTTRVEVVDVIGTPDGQHVVVLRAVGEEVYLPIWIGPTEAEAIARRIAARKSKVDPSPRPMTHDLFEQVMSKLHANVQSVHIDSLVSGVFLARITVRSGGASFEVDARPSDSIALAVGAQAPIFTSRRVIEAAGLREGDVPPAPPEPEDEATDAKKLQRPL